MENFSFIELWLNNFGFVLGGLFEIAIGVWVLIQAPKKPLNILFFLTVLSAAVYMLMFAVGINILDPVLSSKMFFGAIAAIFTICFMTHWTLILVNKVRSHFFVILTMYIVATAMFVFFMFNPSLFILPSKPLSYFPNWYVEGPYFYVANIFYFTSLIYLSIVLVKAYVNADPAFRTRIQYVAGGFMLGFILSLGPVLVTQGLLSDPIMTALFPLSFIPVAYGILNEDLMDTRIVAKKALIYAAVIVAIGALFAGVMLAGVYLAQHVPRFPLWQLWLFLTILSAIVARFFWKRLKVNEEVKYGFIKVVTHNFRTPLTELKWAVTALAEAESVDERHQSQTIAEGALSRITELTNLLVATADAENKSKIFDFVPINVIQIVDSVVKLLRPEYEAKKISLFIEPIKETDMNKAIIFTDPKKFSFVLETLLRNTITYTPEGGQATISMKVLRRRIIIKVKDSGIGISRKNLKGIFNSFSRTENAFKTQTDGLGLNLFIAKTTIEQEGGRIYAKSAGEGKGSTFTVEMPRYLKKTSKIIITEPL